MGGSMTRYKHMEQYINSQVSYWQQQRNKITIPENSDDTKQGAPSNKKPFVTISREFGCSGYRIASQLAETLTVADEPEKVWAAYDKELINRLSQDTGLLVPLVETLTSQSRNTLSNFIQTLFSDFPTQAVIYSKMVEVVEALAANGNVVLVGRGANRITRNIPNGFHVRLIADMDWKTANVAQAFNVNEKEAASMIEEKTKSQEAFYREFLHINASDAVYYDLVINNSRFSNEEAANLIIAGMKSRDLL